MLPSTILHTSCIATLLLASIKSFFFATLILAHTLIQPLSFIGHTRKDHASGYTQSVCLECLGTILMSV